jgi:hypothetical protein
MAKLRGAPGISVVIEVHVAKIASEHCFSRVFVVSTNNSVHPRPEK